MSAPLFEAIELDQGQSFVRFYALFGGPNRNGARPLYAFCGQLTEHSVAHAFRVHTRSTFSFTCTYAHACVSPPRRSRSAHNSWCFLPPPTHKKLGGSGYRAGVVEKKPTATLHNASREAVVMKGGDPPKTLTHPLKTGVFGKRSPQDQVGLPSSKRLGGRPLNTHTHSCLIFIHSHHFRSTSERSALSTQTFAYDTIGEYTGLKHNGLFTHCRCEIRKLLTCP